MVKTFVLNQNLFSRLTAQNLPMVCEYCGKLLCSGDVVVSRQSRTGAKHYHSKCYESMFIRVR